MARSVLVTGGGTGLGRATAIRFAREGDRVAICGRREEILKATAEEIRAAGALEVRAVACDVRYDDDVAKMVTSLHEAWGPLDILVNNAAGNFVCPAEKLSPNGWRAVIEIVLNGTFFVSSAVGRRMIDAFASDARQRSIVNVVADYAWGAGPGVIHSASAKAGVLAMTRTLAVEWARYGIRCNCVSPGPFKSEGTDRNLWLDQELEKEVLHSIPMHRFTTAAEVAESIAFLADESKSAYITGACLPVDGGHWLAGTNLGFLSAVERGLPMGPKSQKK
ncbi:MAG: SDR family oxidoreductase [Acidobacteria bacterium]|nr:SDR family oxidoreductase [Acidobacteriota bacterium]MCK6685665.1 SDR family oxidoreductase [Thermoanaerobaculia bacterium]